jgi:hypothetical protein
MTLGSSSGPRVPSGPPSTTGPSRPWLLAMDGDKPRPRHSASSLYSGKCWKLSGLTTTLYVPGLLDSALRSLSSSVVKAANGGRSSGATAELVLVSVGVGEVAAPAGQRALAVKPERPTYGPRQSWRGSTRLACVPPRAEYHRETTVADCNRTCAPAACIVHTPAVPRCI